MFKALLLTQPVPRETRAECVELDEASLPAGAVRVAVSHSTLNYKDALAITGRSPVVRQFPMVPGIDLAGTDRKSTRLNSSHGYISYAVFCLKKKSRRT